MGADAVLVNTAIAVALDPVRMARAFRKAVEAGREAFETGLEAPKRTASATSPVAIAASSTSCGLTRLPLVLIMASRRPTK